MKFRDAPAASEHKAISGRKEIIMLLKKMQVGILGVNCYIIGDPEETFIIDPGGDADQICDYVDKQGYKVKYIILTHCHFDHVLGAKDVQTKTGAEIVACASEAENLANCAINMSSRFTRTPITLAADRLVSEGEKLTSGSDTFEVIETPGHTSGGMCLYCQNEKMLISGDTLFCESVGRSDFPTGDQNTLLSSINEKLFVLPDETRVYPGHEQETTIGHEKQFNPFIL